MLLFTLLACGSPVLPSSDSPLPDRLSPALSAVPWPGPPEEPTPAFLPTSSEAGAAWAWVEDPDLQIWVAGDDAGEWTRGLYVRYGRTLVASRSARPWLETEGWLPLILALPGESGVLVDASSDLVLSLIGSSEHGCEADDLTARITPRWTHEGISVTIAIDGIFYFAFPGDAGLTIEHADGTLTLPPGSLADEESREFEDATAFDLTGLTTSPIRAEMEPALPWFQVADDGDFLEGDMDHSCELAGPAFRPRTTVEIAL